MRTCTAKALPARNKWLRLQTSPAPASDTACARGRVQALFTIDVTEEPHIGENSFLLVDHELMAGSLVLAIAYRCASDRRGAGWPQHFSCIEYRGISSRRSRTSYRIDRTSSTRSKSSRAVKFAWQRGCPQRFPHACTKLCVANRLPATIHMWMGQDRTSTYVRIEAINGWRM